MTSRFDSICYICLIYLIEECVIISNQGFFRCLIIVISKEEVLQFLDTRIEFPKSVFILRVAFHNVQKFDCFLTKSCLALLVPTFSPVECAMHFATDI